MASRAPKKTTRLAALVASLVVVTASRRRSEEFLLLDEEFDGPLDETRWQHDVTLEGGGNREFQAYATRRENAYTDDGVLFIEPTLASDALGVPAMYNGTMDLRDQGCASRRWWACVRHATRQNVLPPVFSAKLRSTLSFAFGRVEVRAKLPSGEWTWPGIWMMPRDDAYGPWPRSGEVDLMEARGNSGPAYVAADGERLGNDVFASCFHWGPSATENGFSLTVSNATRPVELPQGKTLADAFHTYGLYWSDRELYTYFKFDDAEAETIVERVAFYGRDRFYDVGARAGLWDDDAVAADAWADRGPIAPFDRAFRLILNVAVGGTSRGVPDSATATGYWPDDLGGKPWHNADVYPHTSFFEARDAWLPSWRDRAAAMQLDRVRVWGFDGLTTWSIDDGPVKGPRVAHGVGQQIWWVRAEIAAALLVLAVALGVAARRFPKLAWSQSLGSSFSKLRSPRSSSRDAEQETQLPLRSYGTSDFAS
mmetsp:Transcript_18101/g.72476  ORF Transcript_18101/g.72476 Transcript_18101/m.72476 type:complete len:482 (-) Transcript_18101:61-1506(-)